MAGISGIANIWNNVKEVDLRPIREEAQQVVKIAVLGADGSGRSALSTQMRRDPARAGMETQTPLLVSGIEDARSAADADLIILVIDPEAEDLSQEKELTRILVDGGKKVIIFVNQPSLPGPQTPVPWVDWSQSRVVYGPVEDTAFLLTEFVPVVIDLLPDQLLPLGRYFPLFRVAVAHHLINETSFSNAAYSLSTGLAEVVPVFDIPLNVADMVVLTKTQAFLVYRLGLALGFSTQWQDYVSEFGSVLGGGFLWRQLARSLVGLIPAWGIIPKVAVAYAGTYVVGNVVLQWYLTGRHISRQQMREMYSQAFTQGRNVARGLASKIKVPRPRLGRRRLKALPPPELLLSPEIESKQCPNCGRMNAMNAPDARFCQYCGQSFDLPVEGDQEPGVSLDGETLK